jgi:hypothetical protein
MRVIYLFFVFVNCEKFIKNINVNPCKNCNYYKESYVYSELSKCKKFGEKNIVTNEIKYDYADSCRNNESKCGNEGNYFEDKYAHLKILKQKITNDIPITISLPIVVFCIVNLLNLW